VSASDPAAEGTTTQVGTPEGRRVVELLWNPPSPPAGRGPRPRTSLSEVVDAGVAIADAEGLDALSMRKVASQLGIGAMSLYTYVPGRSELIELMIDRVYADHPLPDPALGWRARLEEWMRATWQTYAAHPWLLDYNMARLPIGPHVLDVEEGLYSALQAAGVTGAENVALANLVRWQLLGAGRATIGDAAEERHTGVSAEAYWESRSSFWISYFDSTRFPSMAAVWEAGGFDDPVGWDFDLMITRLLDGIERLADGPS
jgi:AcrR family transcriptional regulator